MENIPDLETIWHTLLDPEKLLVIAGPCVIESESLAMDIAERLCNIQQKLGTVVVFKASYDKANRTSIYSFRGPGLEKGLAILKKVREYYKLPITTDVHSVEEAVRVGEVVDIIQIPAFLCRQTDIIVAAAKSGKIVNIKKGQFLSPYQIKYVVEKVYSVNNNKALITERGSMFGYGDLVVDFRSIEIIHTIGVPVIFDATHSVQHPGGLGDRSGGSREFIPTLARAAVAAGADGLFFETHPNPDKALSDGPNMIFLDDLENLLVLLQDLKSWLGPKIYTKR